MKMVLKAVKKDKSTKMVKGVRQVQPYGHMADIMDYVMCEEFSEQYILFQNNGMSHDPSGGKRTAANSKRSEADRVGQLRNPSKQEKYNKINSNFLDLSEVHDEEEENDVSDVYSKKIGRNSRNRKR